jgi:hypothetical protein
MILGPKTKNDCAGEDHKQITALLRTTVFGYQSITSRPEQEPLNMETAKGIPLHHDPLPSSKYMRT